MGDGIRTLDARTTLFGRAYLQNVDVDDQEDCSCPSPCPLPWRSWPWCPKAKGCVGTRHVPNFVLQSYLHDASVASPPQVLFSRFHIFVGSLLQLQHLLLDVKAERDRALGLVAGLGVVAAEGNETQTARMSTSARRDCSPSRQVRSTCSWLGLLICSKVKVITSKLHFTACSSKKVFTSKNVMPTKGLFP